MRVGTGTDVAGTDMAGAGTAGVASADVSADVASAGSRPKPRLHPGAVRVLRDRYGIDVAGRRPRQLDALAGHRFDYVITLCDRVREVCPEFAGRPRRLHWSIPDPAATGGDDARAARDAFDRTAAEIDTRVRYLLPILVHAPSQEVQS
ncbi:arsenate reductase/protein-tyrosine-phosphatase family protein [Nonomuraea antri]|uniref:arsenate reductase/protein-tyrosine-phosphatase family protein n=1 Tax=Nonomuraea antri TaxID=2730852 RepID=UPI002E27C650|nr:hypothetical protein [Nonomuraea antri]